MEVRVEPAQEPVRRLEQHYPGPGFGLPNSAFLQVLEERGDLRGQLDPGRPTADDGDV